MEGLSCQKRAYCRLKGKYTHLATHKTSVLALAAAQILIFAAVQQAAYDTHRITAIRCLCQRRTRIRGQQG